MTAHSPKIAFIHDWLVEFGGAEQVLEALWGVWPDAPVFTLVHDPYGPCGPLSAGRQVHTSFLQNMPGCPRRYRNYLPLMPLAIEQFDLRAYDIVFSLSYAVAHGVLPNPGQLHINYICSPMRYAWHLYHQYLEEAHLQHGLKSWYVRMVLHYLRLWDFAAGQRVDEIITLSDWVAASIWKAYRRPVEVIYPPVDVSTFSWQQPRSDEYITIARQVPYKKTRLIVEAFNRMPDKKLVVIGTGPENKALRALAASNVEILGFQPFPVVKQRLERAQGFVYAAIEDFGIAVVEAQACGTPVIAFGQGGVRETVIDGVTGLFYHQQTPEALIQAVQDFEVGVLRFDPAALRRHAENFSKQRFQNEIETYVQASWERFLRPPADNRPSGTAA